MPLHRIPRASLHEDLFDLTRRQGERVVSISADPFDPDRYLVATEFVRLETRDEVAS